MKAIEDQHLFKEVQKLMADSLAAAPGPAHFHPKFHLCHAASRAAMERESHPSHSLGGKFYTILSLAQTWENSSKPDQLDFQTWIIFFSVILSIIFKINQRGFFLFLLLLFVIILSQPSFDQKVAGLIFPRRIASTEQVQPRALR